MKNLSTALAKFASLFDSFSKKLNTMRSEKARTVEDPWSRFWGAKETSFEEELDTTLLAVLEPYKKILTLLKEVRINRILSEAALTPETKVEQAEAFKEKADIKLNELSEEIEILRHRLSTSSEDDNEDRLFESSRFVTSLSLDEDNPSGKFTVTEVPYKRKEPAAQAGPLDTQALRSPFSQSLTKQSAVKNNLGVGGSVGDSFASVRPGTSTGSITDKAKMVEELAMLECDIVELRNYLEDQHDLKIKTNKGVKSLSLPFFLLQDIQGNDRVVLDLEGIVELHSKAIRAVTESWARDADNEKLKPLLARVQKYLLTLYSNLRQKINISSDNMPSTQGELTFDIFLQLEVCANLGDWETIEDIESFKEVFENQFDKPFNDFVSEPKNRLYYLKSIVTG